MTTLWGSEATSPSSENVTHRSAPSAKKADTGRPDCVTTGCNLRSRHAHGATARGNLFSFRLSFFGSFRLFLEWSWRTRQWSVTGEEDSPERLDRFWWCCGRCSSHD